MIPVCPFCGSEAEVVTEASWGYYDHSHIECRAPSCRVKPTGAKKDNTTWTPGKGTAQHHDRTRDELITEWMERVEA